MAAQTSTMAEFAKILGVRRSYVTRLKKDNRLVFTANGRRVLVAESQVRIKATRDPSKQGVADHHAATRAAGSRTDVTTEASSDPASADTDTDTDTTGDTAGYQHWRARNERAKALSAERENAVAEGKLLALGDVTQVVSVAITTLRSRMETMPDVLGPQLAGVSDEADARALLTDHVEHVLDECARAFRQLSRPEVD